MDFNKLLGTLARSSAQAVSTLVRASDEIEAFKDYLYIETPIEQEFVRTLEETDDRDTIIFLCGSSGDGKSEILRRHHETYRKRFEFHLDATHSFKPDQDAIQALNELFWEHKRSLEPLVVGINVGMLCNFQNFGDRESADIKAAIGRFLNGERTFGDFRFISFEDYPKFSLDADNIGSEFISSLLDRLTARSEQNPLYKAFLDAEKLQNSLELHNYRLLQLPSVKAKVVRLLLQARLEFDQFFSARALLDFFHHLVCGGAVLFDNLYASRDNDLASLLLGQDPCLLRTKQIDEFLVQGVLDVQNAEFNEFRTAYCQKYGEQVLSPSAWIRAFDVLQQESVGNNYHQSFAADLKQSLFDDYITMWQLHNPPSGNFQPKLIRPFYEKELIAGLRKFANRLMPNLPDDHIYLCERNGVVLSARAEIKLDVSSLAVDAKRPIQHFRVALKIGDKQLDGFAVTVSFLELVRKINRGYRPNRHDKNTIVILEEVVENILKVARQSNSISFHKAEKVLSLEHEDGEFVAGGN